MLWEVNEHELSDLGMQKKTLEVSPECSEVEFYAQCIDYERELAESCQYSKNLGVPEDQNRKIGGEKHEEKAHYRHFSSR